MRIKILIHNKKLLKRLTISQLVVIFIIFTHLAFTEASRRKIGIDQTYEKPDIMHWTTVINNKMFDVYVDRNAEIIIVQGEVKTFDEKEEVEKYFKSKSPSNYKLICELNNNNLDK